MYARVLCVGSAFNEQTEFCGRILRVLRRAGHGVRVCALPGEMPSARDELVAAYCTFRPTLVLWDVDGVVSDADDEALSGLACCRVALCGAGDPPEHLGASELFDFVVGVSSRTPMDNGRSEQNLLLRFGVDAPYRQASISQPGVVREGIQCVQRYSAEREQRLREAAKHAGVSIVPSINGTWPDSLGYKLPGACPAYYARKTKYSIYFDGDDVSFGSIGLRIAEGSIVLVEEKALANAPEDAFVSSLLTFNANDLVDLLVELEGSEERCAQIAEAQRRALDGAALLEESVSELLCALDRRCREASATPVLAYEDAAARIVLFGWFGAENFGDDLLMRLTATRLEARYPNAQISIIGANPSVIRREYGYEAAEPHEKYRIRGFLEDARAIVYCGGLLFDDPLADTAGELEFMFDPWIEPTGQASVALLAAAHGAQPVLLGIGAGPLSNDATWKAVRLIAMAGALFLPRDVHTAELLLSAGAPSENVRVKADLVFDARSYIDDVADDELPEGLRSDEYFVVSLRQWHLNPEGFEREIASAVSGISDEAGLPVVFVPFDKDDAVIHRAVWELLGDGTRERAVIFDERPDEGCLLALMKGSAFALAMRLHCSVLHHVLGKPAVGLNYNDKIEAQFELVGQRGMLCELNDGAQVLAAKALRAARGECNLDELAECVARRARLAEEAFEELLAVIDAWHPDERGCQAYFPRTIAYSKQQLALARRRIVSTEKALSEERKKTAELSQKLEQVERVDGPRRNPFAETMRRGARGAKRRMARLLKGRQ